jgi:predicted nucleotidyltransferase
MMTLDQAKDIAQAYTKAVADQNIQVEKAYLFGSFSRNTQWEGSDIDIAIISSDFGKCRPDERVALMTVPFDPLLNIEPHPIGLTDFNENDWDPFIKEVKKGIRIV